MSAKPKCGKVYYRFGPDSAGGMSREIVNERTLQEGATSIGLPSGQEWPLGHFNLAAPPWRFPQYRETPKVLWNPKKGVFRDLDNFDGILVISGKAKRAFDAIDPSAFDYRACTCVLPNGEPGPEVWLCHVSRGFLDAVDWPASKGVKVLQGARGTVYSLSYFDTKLKIRPEIVGDAHIFVVAETWSDILCDEAFKVACKEAGLKGIHFRQFS